MYSAHGFTLDWTYATNSSSANITMQLSSDLGSNVAADTIHYLRFGFGDVQVNPVNNQWNYAVIRLNSSINVDQGTIAHELGHFLGSAHTNNPYSKGMTTRQISETIEDIYGFEVSDGMVSDITDRLLPQIEDWQKRPLDEVYPIVFIDAVHFSVRDNGQIRKLAAYVILAVSITGHKEVLSIHIGENESAKYWLGVLNELKNRGVKDILVICADGLTGMKEAVSAAFPQTELQRCIVHQVRNTLKYVGEKNKKEFANDLKTIYHAPSEDAALEALDRVTEKWEDDYPNAMKSWYKNWDVISLIFKFSSDVRKVIYTTNAIESLNSGYHRLNKQRSVFPSDTALLKALYLATHEIAKKWTMPLRNWGKVLGELEIMYPDRIG